MKIAQRLWQSLIALALLSITGFSTYVAANSLPAAPADQNPVKPNTAPVQNYPAPEDSDPTVASRSEIEAFCDEAYEFRKHAGLPDKVRTAEENSYRRCVKARLTPSPEGGYPKIDQGLLAFKSKGSYSGYSRQIGSGIIYESGEPAQRPPLVKTINIWLADIEGNHYEVKAGGDRLKYHIDNKNFDQLPWDGYLQIEVTGPDGKRIKEQNKSFEMPEVMGLLRIVDASGTILTLATSDGISYQFDVLKREFLSQTAGPTYTRKAGEGVLTESSQTDLAVEGFRFENQWSADANPITLLAGAETTGQQRGALIVAVRSAAGSAQLVEETAYVSNHASALRIVDVVGNQVTLSSQEGAMYVFDLDAGQFTFMQTIYDTFTTASLVTNAAKSSVGVRVAPTDTPNIFTRMAVTRTSTRRPTYTPSRTPTRTPTNTRTRTPTPTATPTPRPSRTALPTYNPYP